MMLEAITNKLADGFTREPPKATGLYQFACGELDYAAEYAAVIEAPNSTLIVCEDGLGRTPLPYFHDGLTTCLWKRIA